MASARSRLCRCSSSDLLLDRVAGDQAVGEDVLRLADPVRAVDRLRLDGRVPPGVEQEDVLGRGQVQAEAAGLQADQEEPAVRVVLEPLDPRLRGRASGRRGTRRGCPRRRAGAQTSASKLVNCEKTRALCPSSTTSASCGRSTSSLADGVVARALVDQAGVAGRLAQPQQRLEDLRSSTRLSPSRSMRPEQRGPVVARAARRTACAAAGSSSQ